MSLFPFRNRDSDPGQRGSSISVAFTLTSLALGTLMGASLYKWLTETFGWWQLQLGRVGRYFRRGRER